MDRYKDKIKKGEIVRLLVKVSPNAKKTEVKGYLDDGSLKVSVVAAPEKGRANAAVITLLAQYFGVAKKRVEITAGHTTGRKLVKIIPEA